MPFPRPLPGLPLSDGVLARMRSGARAAVDGRATADQAALICAYLVSALDELAGHRRHRARIGAQVLRLRAAAANDRGPAEGGAA